MGDIALICKEIESMHQTGLSKQRAGMSTFLHLVKLKARSNHDAHYQRDFLISNFVYKVYAAL